MLEGIEGLKLIKEDYYYNLDRTGALLLILGVMLVIIGLSLVINSIVFGRKEYKKYILMPIEEHYSIDLNKYIIDSESDGNLIVIREKQESEEEQ